MGLRRDLEHPNFKSKNGISTANGAKLFVESVALVEMPFVFLRRYYEQINCIAKREVSHGN